MPEALISPDTAYGLAEETIRSQPWLSASTLPDQLARPAVRTAEVEQSSPPPREVVIRRLPADAPLSFFKSVRAVGDLLRLPEGWNSHSAKPIAVRNARTAIELLAQFLRTNTPPPDVVPRVQGGIQLEWHTGKIDIEVYVDSPGQVSFFAEDLESEDDFEGPLRGHEEVLKSWIHRVSQK
jgi:hypothetical protein